MHLDRSFKASLCEGSRRTANAVGARDHGNHYSHRRGVNANHQSVGVEQKIAVSAESDNPKRKTFFQFSFLASEGDHVASTGTTHQRHDLGGDRLHHALVLVGVLMPIVDRRNAALLVILDPVHRIAPEAEAGDQGAVCSSKIVWRRSVHAKRRTHGPHDGVKAIGATTGAAEDEANRGIIGELGQ